MTEVAEPDLMLAEDLGRYYANPLGFVRYAFRWNEDELKGFPGPVEWQAQYLRALGEEVKARGFNRVDPVSPVLMATASGHGIGKSALTAWIILWVLSTRPHSKGVVTANTASQLETKTWAELAKWMRRAINSHWWDIRTGRGAMRLAHKDYPDSWRVDGITCREENSESFAGLHAASASPFYIFDEASAIPTSIWEVAEGGLTDGEPFWLVFGNPTRNTGRFRECWGRLRHRWITRQIDSRTVSLTNKTLLNEWVHDYGEDSDFVRVRVRGVWPRASDMQFIPSDVVTEAMRREVVELQNDPLVLGVDVARGGGDRNVLYWRAGRNGRASNNVPKPIVIPGEETRDSMRLVARIISAIEDTTPDVVFVDGTGVGGPIVDRIRQLRFPVVEVQFGAKAPDESSANMRAYMWGQMREWLMNGGAIPDDSSLEADLCSPEYSHNSRDQLLLESKERMKARGLASPDLADALALTFANPVGTGGRRRGNRPRVAVM